ncbi:hypothetical protein ACJZ2D_010332 [Fusarium nematophilum]
MHSISASICQLKWLHFKTFPQALFDLERFNEASRGPYGSIKFLIGVQWNLATVGVLVTILRLGFAPLAQQAVSLEPRYTLRPPMQSAVLMGLFNVSRTPQFSCNRYCRWDTSHMSLGFKSICKNVTASTLDTIYDREYGPQEFNMTTPAGVGIKTTYIPTERVTTFQINATAESDSYGENFDYDVLEIARVAIYRSTTNPDTSGVYNINITDYTVSFTTYKYSNAKANSCSFSFESIRESDAKNLPRLPISLLDILALKEFILSTAFQSQWIEGLESNPNPGLTAALRGDVDLSQAFQTMARSMTDYLRTGPNMQLARGERVDSQIFVSVRWFWLIGPTAIELAAIVFAVSTMMANQRNVPLWKSSVLAVLECQHEKGSGLIRPGSKDVKKIEKSAKDSKVRLEIDS